MLKTEELDIPKVNSIAELEELLDTIQEKNKYHRIYTNAIKSHMCVMEKYIKEIETKYGKHITELNARIEKLEEMHCTNNSCIIRRNKDE